MDRMGTGVAGTLPDWVPEAARHYLSHTEAGRSLRSLARERGVHASTILRQVRRIEARRDDPLVEAAISALGGHFPDGRAERAGKDRAGTQTAGNRPQPPREPSSGESGFAEEASGALRALVEPGAVLAVAPDMEMAVVVRALADGGTVRLATLARGVAEAMALHDWIAPVASAGRIRRYAVSAAGRAVAARMDDPQPAEADLGEARAGFMLSLRPAGADEGASRRRSNIPYNGAETPVATLARRRESDGALFLTAELVAAAERLREDFEMAGLAPGAASDWEALVRDGLDAAEKTAPLPVSGPPAARARARRALAALGPGLGDVALRCCCRLEGLETAEKALGWAARSGKVVLRIALQRLRRHYDETGTMARVLIG